MNEITTKGYEVILVNAFLLLVHPAVTLMRFPPQNRGKPNPTILLIACVAGGIFTRAVSSLSTR